MPYRRRISESRVREKPYARFNEGGLATISMDSLVRHCRPKVAETDRLILTVQLPVLYSTRNSIPKLPEITMQDKQEDK